MTLWHKECQSRLKKSWCFSLTGSLRFQLPATGNLPPRVSDTKEPKEIVMTVRYWEPWICRNTYCLSHRPEKPGFPNSGLTSCDAGNRNGVLKQCRSLFAAAVAVRRGRLLKEPNWPVLLQCLTGTVLTKPRCKNTIETLRVEDSCGAWPGGRRGSGFHTLESTNYFTVVPFPLGQWGLSPSPRTPPHTPTHPHAPTQCLSLALLIQKECRSPSSKAVVSKSNTHTHTHTDTIHRHTYTFHMWTHFPSHSQYYYFF